MEVCGDCKFFKVRKEDIYDTIVRSDGECLNRKITKKDKDFDDKICNNFEKR